MHGHFESTKGKAKNLVVLSLYDLQSVLSNGKKLLECGLGMWVMCNDKGCNSSTIGCYGFVYEQFRPSSRILERLEF